MFNHLYCKNRTKRRILIQNAKGQNASFNSNDINNSYKTTTSTIVPLERRLQKLTKRNKNEINQRKTIKLNPTTKFKKQMGVWLLGRVYHCSQPLEHRSSLLTPIGMLRASIIRFQPPPILMWRCGRFPNTVIQFHLFPHSSINTTEAVFFPNVKAQNDS